MIFKWLKSIIINIFSYFKVPDKPMIELKSLYENKYPLTTPRECISETDDNFLFKRVEDVTPDGKVTMEFDSENTIFKYWADKSVQYRYLETVARKYCILYNCIDNYQPMYKEEVQVVHESKPIKDSPFVTFKPYNKKNTKLKYINEKSNQYKHMGKELPISILKQYKPFKYTDFKSNIDV